LQGPSILDDPEQNDNDCDDEQNVDEPVHRHGRQEAEELENDEYHSERPQRSASFYFELSRNEARHPTAPPRRWRVKSLTSSPNPNSTFAAFDHLIAF
jgi:hypothetical protein